MATTAVDTIMMFVVLVMGILIGWIIGRVYTLKFEKKGESKQK